jgi:enoyl-CoA hydratase
MPTGDAVPCQHDVTADRLSRASTTMIAKADRAGPQARTATDRRDGACHDDEDPHRERKPIRMDLASYQHLKLERKPENVTLVTLNRPEVLNAAHEAMHAELATIWADLSRDEETRVVVVTGAGRAFSAGGDLGMVERQIGNYDLVTHMLREMSDLVYNMANCEKPIVSAINGVAVGAGLVVALLADISICADDARLGDGHVRLGVAAGDHAAIIWPLLCGLAKAKYYLLTGEMVTGAEAERIGLVSKALPAEDVLPEAMRVAHQLATGPQLAIRLTKRALNGWIRDAGPIFDQSAAYEMLTFMGEDIKEGLASLRQKRAPQFG